jgi:nucleoside-diphosphate-sugar epimerase
MNKADIVLHTDGSSEGNYCCLADTVAGILTIMLKGQDGEAYNVVNEDLHMTVKQMAQFVADEIAKGKIKVTLEIPPDAQTYGYAPSTRLYLTSEKLRSLGWRPQYSMKDKYERMIEYWTEQ